MLFGDVIATIAGLIGISLTTWATMLACALLFAPKTVAARRALDGKLAPVFFKGLLVLLIGGGLAVGLISAPPVAAKVVGLGLLAIVLATGAVGTAGIATLTSERIRQLHPAMSEFTALSRGSGILIAASILPVAGTFLFFPAIIIMGLGAGYSALFGRVRLAKSPVSEVA